MKKKDYALLLVRLSIGIVFLLFGIDKLVNPSSWLGYIPGYINNLIPFSIDTFIIILGIGESILGVLFILGLFTWLISLLSAIHLSLIIISVGYNDVAIRDFGLFLVVISLMLIKRHPFSLDSLR